MLVKDAIALLSKLNQDLEIGLEYWDDTITYDSFDEMTDIQEAMVMGDKIVSYGHTESVNMKSVYIIK